MKIQVAVIGSSEATGEELKAAYLIGSHIAIAGAVLLCGGRGGVMEAAAQGVSDQGGMTVGILPGIGDANPYVDIRISTDMGNARNVILVLSSDVVIAIGGSYGTLSEIAIAKKVHRPIYGWKTWDIDGIIACKTPEETVSAALARELSCKDTPDQS